MSEARSLTPLSETDYEAIEAAVMETARGRWFMAEFARRNRHADTQQILGAIHRIERVVGTPAPQPMAVSDIAEATALIADLRIDLERISGRAEDRASGLAARIEAVAGTILQATESIQEVAWNLREAGAGEGLCDKLDQHAAEIATATAVVDGTVQQIDKIADTIAMLDSSLRAVSGLSSASVPSEAFIAPLPRVLDIGLVEAPPYAGRGGVEIIEIDDEPVAPVASGAAATGLLGSEPRIGSILELDDDVVFDEPDVAYDPASTSEPLSLGLLDERHGPSSAPASAALASGSEAGLREIDAMPASRKLAYFA
ncbi:MAG: hypothetical protein O9330_08355 [Beijerinckiaceae bacterium]|jgi:hypothetical protein|nr:hypothetical protein [Beijerinckiaceae bacterium]